MKNILRLLSCCLSCTALLFLPLLSHANSKLESAELLQATTITFNKVQSLKVIEVHPAQVPAMHRQAIDKVSLYALQENKLLPIPFQFEEFDHLGLLMSNSASAAKEKSFKGIFDNDDLLVFMLKDSGPQATPEQLKNLDIISDIKIEDGNLTTYVYLVRNGEISDRIYVHYDKNSGLISMPAASIGMNPKDLLDWGDVIPAHDADQKSLLDCFKIRINGKFLAFQLKLNNNNLQARLKKVHEGPVRLTLDAEIRAVVAKAPLLKADAQLHFDSSSARIFIDMHVPGQYSKLIKDPVVVIGVDGNNLYGQTVQTSVSGKSTYRVDGKMDSREKALNKVKVKEPVSWIWLRDENDLNLIGQYDLSANENFDPKNYPEITIFYVDDAEKIDKPERFRGSTPTLGYRLDGLPASDQVKMSYKILLINQMQPLSAGEFLQALDNKPRISVSQ